MICIFKTSLAPMVTSWYKSIMPVLNEGHIGTEWVNHGELCVDKSNNKWHYLIKMNNKMVSPRAVSASLNRKIPSSVNHVTNKVPFRPKIINYYRTETTNGIQKRYFSTEPSNRSQNFI